MKRIPALVMLAVAGSSLLTSANAQQYDIDGNLIGSKTTVTAPGPTKIVQKRIIPTTKTTTTTTTPTTTIKSSNAVCDPQCNGTTCSYGYLTCDGGCKAGYGLDPTNHTCIACTSANCAGSCNINGPATCDGPCNAGYGLQSSTHLCKPSVNGNWSDWYYTVNCTVPGNLMSIQQRYCNNPIPAFGGANCTNTAGCTASQEINVTTCACDPHCQSACTKQGYLKCDSACIPGWGLNTSDHTCRACNSSHCNGSCNTYGPRTCDGPCDPDYAIVSYLHTCQACGTHCTLQSGCNVRGAGKCDTGCTTGWALTTSYICTACDNYCNLNVTGCNIEGGGFCDPCNPTPCSSCLPGYGIRIAYGDPTKQKHACYPCAAMCKGVCDIEGAGCCDPTSDPTTACTVGYTYTATNGTNGGTCHVCKV